MVDFVTNLFPSTWDPLFWASATLGTTFFLLRVIMSLFGGGFFEHDADIDDLHGGVHHDDSLFKFLSTHSLSGFLMMFGWAGLACTVQFNMPTGQSLLIALASGMAMLGITAMMMRAAMSLESSGAVFSSKKALGLTGTVSQRVPAHGHGKVQLVINNSTRELLAQSHDKKPIESFTVVKVLKVIDHEIVEIAKLEEKP